MQSLSTWVFLESLSITFLKKFLVKKIFIPTVFEILMFEPGFVLRTKCQRGSQGAKELKF